jgi:hypothetical protein
MISFPSFHDLPNENSYHLIFFTCFASMLGFSSVTSNCEAGHGRYDVRVDCKNWRRMFVFEFKKSKSLKSLSPDATNALKQIISKRYVPTYERGYKYYAIGVAFYVKEMSALKVKQLR